MSGVLEVGIDNGEVVINHPDLKPDANGVGHIVFSADQARNLARSLMRKANEIDPPKKYEGSRLGRGVRWYDPSLYAMSEIEVDRLRGALDFLVSLFVRDAKEQDWMAWLPADHRAALEESRLRIAIAPPVARTAAYVADVGHESPQDAAAAMSGVRKL